MPQGKLKVKAQLPAAVARRKQAKPKKAGKVTKAKHTKAAKKGNEHLKNVKLSLEKAIREDIENSMRSRAISTEGRSMSTASTSNTKGLKGKKKN